MGYDLYANNTELKSLDMGLSWLHLLEQCGAYFTCIHRDARWYTLWDERMTTHHHGDDEGEREDVVDKYPAIICNCGFAVTAEEAHVLARVARNYAAIQRSFPEPTEEERNQPISTPAYLRPFPEYIRRDWVERFEQFAAWAEQSDGFTVH